MRPVALTLLVAVAILCGPVEAAKIESEIEVSLGMQNARAVLHDSDRVREMRLRR